jgi:LmbE family N-acetylglucosaminyl deacetylase
MATLVIACMTLPILSAYAESVSSPQVHLVISPHPDDAVLSIGALISLWRRRDDAVTVLTVFSGGTEGEPLAPAAIEDRSRYSSDPIPTRLAEDLRALMALDTQAMYLGLPEVVYRWSANGRPRIPSLDDSHLFGAIQPEDRAVIDAVTLALGQAVHDVHAQHDGEFMIHGPAGIGNHIDHLIVHEALVQLGIAVEWYDDLPYAIREGRDAPLNLQRLEDVNIDYWINAIEHYRSQIPNLFGDSDWQTQFRSWVRPTDDPALAD